MTESENKTDFIIEYPAAKWSLRHPVDAVNGPRHVQVDGDELINSFLGVSDASAVDSLVLTKSRSFRKSGSAVFESEGHFRQQSQHLTRQVIRYAGNAARVTLDLHWGRGDSKLGVAQSVLRLAGDWQRMLVLRADSSEPATWRELQPGKVLAWRELPLAVIFERRNGRRVEYSTGFDLWRWHNGLGVAQEQMQFSVRVSDNELLFYRQLLPAGTGVEPQLRYYRFCSMLAWSAPKLASAGKAPDLRPLAFLPAAGGLDLSGLSGDRGAYSVDFNAAALASTAYRQGDDDGQRLPALCWCSKVTQAMGKRVIRQLAARHSGGFLRLSGLTPGLCNDGAHCERRQATSHWDLQDILNFMAWARQTLGDDWVLDIPQPAPWRELPSLAALGAISGFRREL